MAKHRWLSGLVVGVSLGVMGCGDDPPANADSGVDASGDLGTVDSALPDAGPADTGRADTGATDAGPADTGPADTGPADTGPADTGLADTGPADTGPADTGPLDSGPADTGPLDAGPRDTGPADTGPLDAGPRDTGPADTGPVDSGPPPAARTVPTNGSAVVLTRDDRVTVATNRTAHTISIFSNTLATAPPAAARTTVIPTPGAEPWAAVIGNDDNTAYVILRHSQELVRIGNLRTTPSITGRIAVGSEPTGVAISPMGAHVYVANWANGTVSDVNVSGATMTLARTIDLNAALAGAPGAPLGPTVAAGTARPGLAHPRAIVVTNDGDTDDADETVYVTEFFAQYIAPGLPLPSGEARLDVDHRGLVYRFNAGTGVAAAAITIQPFATTNDSTEAGCFPNQLYAAAIKGDRLFVTSVCESPRRPVNPRQNLFAAISLINLTTNLPDTGRHVLLTRAFENRYAATATAVPDTSARRFPLIPNDIAFIPSGNVAYVSSYGSDALFRVEFNADFSLNQVGQGAAQHFIDLGAGASPGRLPIGVAIAHATPGRAVVLNENTRNLSLVDLGAQASSATVASADPPAAGLATNVNIGRRFFVTGLGRWSLNGQGWGSCEGCHPDGLTDNVTWTFAAGPRQTTSLDGSFDRSGTNQRVFNWTAILDEVHDFEANTRGASGGVGALVHRTSMPPNVEDRIVNDGTTATGAQRATATPQAGLNGSTRSITAGTPGTAPVRSVLDDWEQIDRYVRTIRPPRAPNGLTTAQQADVTAGRALFVSNNCGGCHGSAPGTNLWTVSRRFYEPSEARNHPTTGTLRTQRYTGFPTMFAALNRPSSNPARMAPFRISGADAMAAGSGDQINCVLRTVGTLGGTATAPTPIAPTGVNIFEIRAPMGAAQGFTGYNPPALVGMGSGAPFFHAGNARTLEEAFSDLFRSHHQALSANFLLASDPLRATQVRQLVAFLVSIDDDTPAIGFPTHPVITNFDLCAGFVP